MGARIPSQFIDDLLDKSDIVASVGQHVRLTRAGHEYRALCPFHEEKTPSFYVSPQKRFYHCFGCGAHGSVISFLMEHQRLDFRSAVEQLATQCGLTVPTTAGQAKPTRHLYELLAQTNDFFSQKLRSYPKAIDYLKTRGITHKEIDAFSLGYAPGDNALLGRYGGTEEGRRHLLEAGLISRRDGDPPYDRFRNRMIFPIRDARGRVLAFGGRLLAPGEPKYLNSPETTVFTKRSTLYGTYESRQARANTSATMLVEGYMDVIALAQHGYTNTLATLGTAVTAAHITTAFNLSETLHLCFDGDKAGRKAAVMALTRALPALRDGRHLRFAFLPRGTDPDSFIRSKGSERFDALLSSAASASAYLIEHLTEGEDTASAEGRARIAEEARPYLVKLPSGVLKDLVLDKLASIVRMPRERFEVLLQRSPRRRGKIRHTAAPKTDLRLWPLAESLLHRLIHYPDLARQVAEPPVIGVLRHPGIDTFLDALSVASAHKSSSSGALLERFRDTPNYALLSKLLTKPLPLTPEQAVPEFLSGLARLQDIDDRARLATRAMQH